MKRAGILGVMVLGLLVIVYALLSGETDEEKIRGKLAELGLAVSYSEPQNPLFHKAGLNKRFKTLFSPGVVVAIPEIRAHASGIEELSNLGVGAARYSSTLDVAFSDVVVTTLEKDRAEIQATATVAGAKRGEPERDTRKVEFTFGKVDGDWLIVSASVAPKSER